MAKTGLRVRASRPEKFKVRNHNRCPRCGRARAYMRLFALCRICFRDLALRGEIQGVTKSSW